MTNKTWFFYLMRSLMPNEELNISAGVSKTGYRDYLKIAEVIFSLPCKSKAHALAVEKEAHRFLDEHYPPRSWVKWSKYDFVLRKIKSPINRTNEWWLVHDFDNVHTSKFQEIYELCRNRQLNWKEDFSKYGKAKEGKTVTPINEAKEGIKK